MFYEDHGIDLVAQYVEDKKYLKLQCLGCHGYLVDNDLWLQSPNACIAQVKRDFNGSNADWPLLTDADYWTTQLVTTCDGTMALIREAGAKLNHSNKSGRATIKIRTLIPPKQP